MPNRSDYKLNRELRISVVEPFLLDLKRDNMGRVTGCNNPKMCGYSPSYNGGYANVENEICPIPFCSMSFQAGEGGVDGLMKDMDLDESSMIRVDSHG